MLANANSAVSPSSPTATKAFVGGQVIDAVGNSLAYLGRPPRRTHPGAHLHPGVDLTKLSHACHQRAHYSITPPLADSILAASWWHKDRQVRQMRIVHPPSTANVCPVRNVPSLKRYVNIEATSLGLPKRPMS